MKKLIIFFVLFILSFLIGKQLMLYQFPKFAYKVAKQKINRPDNEVAFAKLPDANSRFVVKPNPDFLYVTCFFDLSEGPLHLTGNLPDSSYWSISFYNPSTENYYVKNDQNYQQSEVSLVLRNDSQETVPNVEDHEVVSTEQLKGLILFRILVADHSPENLARLSEFQKSIQINPYQYE